MNHTLSKHFLKVFHVFGQFSVTCQMMTKSQAHQLQREQGSILKDISH